jgi:hypothetical protein
MALTYPANFTALHYAAMRGFKGTVLCLLRKGADVRALSKFGDDAAGMARDCEQVRVAKNPRHLSCTCTNPLHVGTQRCITSSTNLRLSFLAVDLEFLNEAVASRKGSTECLRISRFTASGRCSPPRGRCHLASSRRVLLCTRDKGE